MYEVILYIAVTYTLLNCVSLIMVTITRHIIIKGCRMGSSEKVSLWYVSLLINTKFPFFILEYAIVKRI